MIHIGVVAETNLKAEPAQDRAGRPWPKHYVFIRKPWAATPSNPDPVTAHPIPVFIDRHHKSHKDWEPLPVGTRVLVATIHQAEAGPEGLAVIGIGPQTDAILGDTRETSSYREWSDGGIDRAVVAGVDPVEGDNADAGRDRVDGRGWGWKTRNPHQGDPNRDEAYVLGPNTTMLMEKRLDGSVIQMLLTHGAQKVWMDEVTKKLTIDDGLGQKITLDGLAKTITLTDGQGDTVTINGAAKTVTVATVNGMSVNGRAVILTGDPVTTVDSMGHAGTGTVTGPGK